MELAIASTSFFSAASPKTSARRRRTSKGAQPSSPPAAEYLRVTPGRNQITSVSGVAMKAARPVPRLARMGDDP
eukprot:scaffold295555_cov28-Tisochrysis_lutea.AAC.5